MLVVDLIAHRLQERGVRFVFGMPGGATVPLMAALDRVGIEFILVRHEGSAGFMADAVFQRTGGLGVCIHSGPGVTNLEWCRSSTLSVQRYSIINQCEDHLGHCIPIRLLIKRLSLHPFVMDSMLENHRPEWHS